MQVIMDKKPVVRLKTFPKVGDVFRNTKGRLMICTFVSEKTVRFMRVNEDDGQIDAMYNYLPRYISECKWRRVGTAKLPDIDVTLTEGE